MRLDHALDLCLKVELSKSHSMMRSGRMKKYILVLAVLLFSSCATAPRKTPVPSAPPPKVAVSHAPAHLPSQPAPVPSRRDVTHVVAPGETLAAISQMYDVPAGSIVSANHLKKAASLSSGRSLIIPQASAPRSIIPLFPNKKWKYIIVHHSATQRGDSLAFNQFHLKRGFVGGVGYDFVIDNGTLSKVDGQIEVTPRWLQQQEGRHCKASHMNQKAIGICLVGNFNEGKVSERQMEALAYLVEILCRYYKIPEKHILGHGKVPDADTDCPGKAFPWQQFNNRLRSIDVSRMMPGANETGRRPNQSLR
jgi:LysM repeat protein